MRVKLIFLSILLLLLTIPNLAIAVGPGMHYFDCKECHASGLSLAALSTGNVCLKCHDTNADGTTFLNEGNPHGVAYNVAIKGNAKFSGGDASARYGNNPTPIDQISHNWATSPTNPEAGATNPSLALHPTMSGNRGRNNATLNCSRCHNTHGAFDLVVNPSLLVNSDDRTEIMATDDLCTACHTGFSGSLANPGNDALLTHPLLNATQLAVAEADVDNAGKFFPMVGALPVYSHTDPFANDVQLVDNAAGNAGISCMTCHGLHFTDSNSSTPDGPDVASDPSFSGGDGLLLRSDGPTSTGIDRDATAQKRSNLCQTCHTYKLHGKGGDNHQIGCLDCHGGHSYNGGVPNAYVLKSQSLEDLPTRINGTNSAPASITFGSYAVGDNTRSDWSDDTLGTADGYCEQCHGDIQGAAIVTIKAEHAEGNANACTLCHKHNLQGGEHTFDVDASEATCGACHGFPPYLSVAGNESAGGTTGGYAFNNVETPFYGYNSVGYYKDEAKTAHKTHAGNSLGTNPGEWYFVGTGGIQNCQPCHGDGAGTTGHRILPTTDVNTFRDVPFNTIANSAGNLTPVYNQVAATCDAVYCHTNGAPRTGDGPTRSYATTHTTPPWVGDGSNYSAGGYNSIFGQAAATRCSDCHGNSAATMITQNNSPAHQAHLGGGAMAVTFGCEVCHAGTVDSSTALKAGATDGRTGGEHVNSVVDVEYKSTGSTLYNALAINGTGVNYDLATGTCSVFCHDPADTGNTADWDSAVAMQCDSCHGGIATDGSPIATGSHARHISTAGNGPQMSCEECHGANSTAGTHTGHLDGIVDIIPPVDGGTFASICEECHGYEGAPEILPVWNIPATSDCATCHAGSQCGTQFTTAQGLMTPPAFDWARISGHNRPTSAGAYPESGNGAANADCTSCHLTDSAAHWDGTTGDLLLRTDGSFPATYAGNENAFCNACHDDATAQAVNTHQSKNCIACHNLHGESSNIQMIWSSAADQTSHDASVTGKYAGDVFFTNSTNFTAPGSNSYDEDDGAVGGAGEANSDDICATCHTTGAGTAHNNSNNSTGDHYQGEDCFTCHATHADPANAFKAGAGTACNDCHDYPPTTGAHGDGTNLHSRISNFDKDTEDRTDCAYCHTGADLYTYDLSADQSSGNADRDNHGVSQANRRTVLLASVGYETTNFSCATACHASSNGDGEWDDANGLNCDACHYYSASASSAGNAAAGSRALSASHDEHFDASKVCADCHTMNGDYNGGASHLGPLTHIDSFTFAGAADDGAGLVDMATADRNEAGAGATGVNRTNMTFTPGVDDAAGGNNTCSGTGLAAGCHATGSPDWDVEISADSTGCVQCHTDTDTAAYNPTSGLHDNNPGGPTVTGNSHDGSFDDGNLGTGDCITCHTATPSAAHINGVLGTPNVAADVTFVGGTCAPNGTLSACHSAGNTWAYKWDASAYNTDGTQCANCHGDYASGWNTGVAPHTDSPTRGSAHNNIGTLTYPCRDCHGIGSASGYNWTEGTNDWAAEGTTQHGDGIITMNQSGVNVIAVDTAPNPDRVGCTTSACHNQVGSGGISGDTTHTFPVTNTAFTYTTVAGDTPDVKCSGCHGGYTPGGTDALGYWPDGVVAPDTAGTHQKHILELASRDMGQTLTQLLNDNVGAGTPPWDTASSDAKQKEICSYCHATPGSDGDHSETLPAEVLGSMFNMWSKGADNGSYDAGADTCATVDCHFNKTTPDNTFGWYDGNTSDCVMCHTNVTTDTAHTAHTGAFSTFGITIGCADCHETDTDWDIPTPPATGHLNNSYDISGDVAFTYSANTCGTNACHEDGRGNAPKDNTYTWGSSLSDCTICHDASPTTSTHGLHNASSYVTDCNDCHTPATNAGHIGGDVTYNTTTITANAGTTPNVTCTNSCHTGAAAEFDATPALACTDCHSGSYIGTAAMPQYAMHALTPTVSGVVHDETAPGAGGDCAFCHDSMPASGGSHIDGSSEADLPNNTDRGLFAGFTEGATPTCTTSCHTAGTSWTYKWSATAGNTDGTECANCHGDFANGWNTGVGHAVNAARGNSGPHTDTGTLSYECTACHAIGSTPGNYTWTSGTNDWATEGTTLHGDGDINVNQNGATPTRSTNAGCQGCHSVPDGVHDFPISSWNLVPVTGDAPAAGGGCTTCHNDGGTGTWPEDDGTFPYRGGGKHLEHVSAIASAYFGVDSEANRNNSCDFCHLDPGGLGHESNGGSNDSADVTGIKRITDKAADTAYTVNGQGSNYVTCSTVDCHFSNAVTPHWYTDDIPPAAVTLSAAAGPDPRSIEISWLAPGDDGNTPVTTPYVYDMRYGTSQAVAENYSLTDNYVGSLPAAYAQGYASSVVVQNLDPGTTYWFSMKTRDVAGNWSGISNSGAAISSNLATLDQDAPAFGGADKANKGDEGSSINLYWTAAEDHSMPITYKIYMKDEADFISSNPIDLAEVFDEIPEESAWTDTKIELNSSNGVVNDHIYHLGVRACDAEGNCDNNFETVSVTPTALPEVPKVYQTYYSGGTSTALSSIVDYTGLDSANALPLVFAPSGTQSADVEFVLDTFAIYLENTARRDTIVVNAEVGITTNGTNFTPLSTPIIVPVTLGGGAKRVVAFKILNLLAPVLVGNGEQIAIELSEGAGAGGPVQASWGDTTTRGDLSVAEQLVNAPPIAVSLGGTSLNGAIVNMTWTEPGDGSDGVTDTVHYDLYGTNDNWTTTYVIQEHVPFGTSTFEWDTQTAGITSGTLAVRVNAGDGYSHTTTNFSGFGSADLADDIAPNAINDLTSKTRPKSGAVWLTWTAPGDDYGNHGRAAYYDIRYSTSAINEGNFDAIPDAMPASGHATGEPSPKFGGQIENFEVTGLDPLTSYNIAIRTYDEEDNPSLLSNVEVTTGGPRCGMCHTTGPSVVESEGNHKLHGFTLNDCDKCHTVDPGGPGETKPSGYGLDHQDGELVMGYGPGGAYNAAYLDKPSGTIYYTDNGTPGGTKLYEDTNGWGGFGNGDYALVGPDETDSGTCTNFGSLGVGGCHGSAGTDPDGGGPLPTYNTPTWDATATLICSTCHGNPDRVLNSYDRYFDGHLDAAADPQAPLDGEIPEQILGAPTVDNHGNYDDTGAGTGDQRKYIGQHDKHLNYSFRFSKGDSCNLCHSGDYMNKATLDGKHADGKIDIQLDLNAAGPDAEWLPGNATTPGSCSNLSAESCHPKDVLAGGTAPTAMWDTNQTFDCRECHGMGGATPSHTTDSDGGLSPDGLGNCTWCHFGGHPRDDVGGTALILANSSQVGINYRSGGIHLKKTIGSHGTFQTEAELCWGCHDDNSISEWGADDGFANVSTEPKNLSDYNYGALSGSNWTTATWYSAYDDRTSFTGATHGTYSDGSFNYKSGPIQSTHSTNELGTSAVSETSGMGSYTETKDTVVNIRCSNCHDVHDLAKAPGDVAEGAPYLRGTWLRNPYPEDGAPWNKNYAVAVTDFGAVPRAGGNEMGGYQIDQNNNNPTAGESLPSSAGLCTLCHGSDIEAMDKTDDGASLWVGTGNGHSNAALGGTAADADNIFDYSHGRPTPVRTAESTLSLSTDVFNMGLQVILENQPGGKDPTSEYGYGYRGGVSGPGYLPNVPARANSFNAYTWGATVDGGTTDVGYHAFSCSKCHNPHASRLPKLMITNCLDVSKNTWGAGKSSAQNSWTAGTLPDTGKTAEYHVTAQNCHRYDGTNGGWNKVTPW